MPTTPNGLPYPPPTDPPNGPLQIQQLAEALELWLPRDLVKQANENLSNSAAMQNDDDLKAVLQPGSYRVTLLAHVGGPAAADVKLAWTGTFAAGSTRSCFGPGSTTTNAAETVMRATAASVTGAVPYGTDGVATSAILEELYLVVAATTTLQLQWAQNTANASQTTMAAGSRLYWQKVTT